ncbi:MAG: phosphate/phosphite/phosphonate ABC transporter substrate-binding protein [Nitrospiraceae bacterium]|nr:phosphate/phosphite/phosphonate ABC transporter substrate-binding protein [Nitrospiraceae bacterium]
MIRKTILAFFLVLLVTANAVAGEKTLLIGLVPEENIFRLIEKNLPLAAYIQKKTGIKVQFTIEPRYGDIIDKFKTKQMDGAFFNAFTGFMALSKLGVAPLVRPISPGGLVTSQSVIFVRKGSGIRSLSDMKGKRAVFVDNASASYIYLLYQLHHLGFKDTGQFFSGYYFTGNNEETIYAVLDGMADVGLAKSRYFEQLAAQDPLISEMLSVLARSGDLPDIVLCLRKDFPAGTKALLERTLLNMRYDPDGIQALRILRYSGFEKAKASDFSAMAKLAAAAGINISNYRYTR